jgi:hypothetical protein
MSEIWTQIIKMRSRYWWPWAEFIRAETLIMEWSELRPDFNYFLAFVFPLTNITEISFLVADWRVKHRLCELSRHVCVSEHTSWRIGWRSYSTVSSDVSFFPPPPYNQTILSPLLPVNFVNFASRMTYKTLSDLRVNCPYSAFMNQTYVLWDGWAWLHRHPTLPLNFALWRYTLYKNVYFRQMAMLEFTESTYRLSSRNFYVHMKL